MNHKPSAFIKQPWDSVLQKAEHEDIARNIMVILARTGDEFRPLTYEEYALEIKKDKHVPHSQHDFNKVIESGYFKNSDTAQLFSPNWKID